jgi:hypothetical protein
MREMNINLSILQIPDSENMQMNCRKLKQNSNNLHPMKDILPILKSKIEDPIIVIKNDHFESVTSRERSKYLKHARVYEIGVSLPKS